MLRFTVIIVLISFSSIGSAQSFYDSHKKKITKELSKWNEGFSALELLKTVDKREFYKINCSVEEGASTLVLSSGQGRFDKFDLMTIVNDSGIELIKVLKYRSEYGSEITNKKWLSQFYHKPEKEFTMRKNIDAISGATYSANGIVSEINQILKSLGKIKNKS